MFIGENGLHHECFTVKGKPFFSIGIQLHNSSGYALGGFNKGKAAVEYDVSRAFAAAEKLHANTVAVPVGWDAFEPEEGRFNGDFIRNIIACVRAHGLHAILLWFGTWKNGQMEYTPDWFKRDRKRFTRCRMMDGEECTAISPFCKEAMEADKRAFCELLRVVKEFDGEENTVIAIQVENEPGMLAMSIRDFGEKANALFASAPDEKLLEALRGRYPHSPFPCVQAVAKPRSWKEAFGDSAAEMFMAWGTASYINEIIAAGKKVYDIFMYVNAWLDWIGNEGWSIPGMTYPSGGAVCSALPVWRCILTEADTISPDIYTGNPALVEKCYSLYGGANALGGRTGEKPLYVPESARTYLNAATMFDAVGRHRAIGYHIFGGESALKEDGCLEESAASVARSFGMLEAIRPLLEKGLNAYPLVQTVGCSCKNFNFSIKGGRKMLGLCSFGYTRNGDWRNRRDPSEDWSGTSTMRELGRGLLVNDPENENGFYLVGEGLTLCFRENNGFLSEGFIPFNMTARMQLTHNMEFSCYEEGHFEGDTFVTDRVRSGDEARHGIWANAKCGVVHFVIEE